MSDLQQTPLTLWHKAQGAKMAPFAGWEMPIQYKGIIAEHNHTRELASLFDICHMGEFLLKGAGAQKALSKIVTHNLATLGPGKCRYGFLLNEQGTILDDLIVYCFADDSYMLVVNAACIENDFAWIQSHLPDSLEFTNVSDETAKIDLQGPKALDVLETALKRPFRSLKYFNTMKVSFDGAELLVSRTGYTGELGYELYLPVEKAPALWELCLAHKDAEPAGLGARDTLRLEAGLPLYGQDLDTEHTPTEAGFGWLLTSEAEYVGKGADRKVDTLLTALCIEGRRSARHGDAVTLLSGEEVGIVTSGSFCPSVGHALALAYITREHAEGTSFLVKGARTSLEATRAELPFYTEGTARMKFD